MPIIIEPKTVNHVTDLVIRFIAIQTKINTATCQAVYGEIFRLFLNSWVNRGCKTEEIRCSKIYWFTVQGFKDRGEFASLIKWALSLIKFILAILFQKSVICCGTRDKSWVQSFYGRAAARIDFHGRPDFIVRRKDILRSHFQNYLVEENIHPDHSVALAKTLPEDLLEGCILLIKIFSALICATKPREICSEDLIENVSSACLVAATLRFGWEFTYKEHALPTLIFRNHISWEHARVASKVILTEDYERYIPDESIRRKCVYSKKNRRCLFAYNPKGKRLLCMPFVSGFASGIHWTGDSDYVRDLRFDERDCDALWSVLKSLSQNEEILTRYHPCRCEGVSLSKFPVETFDDSGVREVVFVGWTQGFFECVDAGIPVRIILTRRFVGLSEGGTEYFDALEKRGLLEYLSASSVCV